MNEERELTKLEKSLLAIEQEYKEKLDAVHLKDIDRYSRSSNWAGELGFPCDTFQAAARLIGDKRPKFTLKLKQIFRPGNVWESANYDLIKEAKINIIDRIGRKNWPEYNIAMKLDFRVGIPDPKNGNEIIIPMEHKTCSPNVFRSIWRHKIDGTPLTQSRYFWVRKYPGQLTSYELMEGAEYGMFFFFEKVTGNYFFWLVPLDLEYGEELIQRAERSNKNVAEGNIPKPKFTDICHNCDFEMTFCFPDKDYGEGFEFIDHEETELKIKRYFELEQQSKEHAGLKSELIGKKANPGTLYGRNIVIGNYQITSTEKPYTFYPVPKEMKESFKKTVTYFDVKIEKIGEKDVS